MENEKFSDQNFPEDRAQRERNSGAKFDCLN